MICIDCSRTLEPRAIHVLPDGTEEVTGDCYISAGGLDVLCESCAYRSRQQYVPLPTLYIDEDELGPPREAVGYDDWRCAYYDSLHPYLPPGSHGGGSSSGRYKNRKTGTRIEREQWGGFS